MFLQSLKTPENLLLIMAFAATFSYSVWQVVLNNFVIEQAGFGSVEIGILQSLREVPGFLAFAVVFFLLLVKEQKLAFISLFLMMIGIAITGFFPFASGLYLTTVLMSIGFHYYETLNNSLTLQWVNKSETPQFMGRGLAVRAVASLSAYGLIWLLIEYYATDYRWIYLGAGSIGFIMLVAAFINYPKFSSKAEQHTHIVVRSRYWLYYALVFFSGARRQIFVVFAGFMMVDKFGYSVADISLLFIVNYLFNLIFAAKIGRWIAKVGERTSLICEYIGLVGVFVSYAFVTHPDIAAALYVIDHLFFALGIAINTYFQKISDPKDIASTASLSFTINHIAAVFIPFVLGLAWVYSPSLVFLIGAGFAFISLLLALNVPRNPCQGNEVIAGHQFLSAALSRFSNTTSSGLAKADPAQNNAEI